MSFGSIWTLSELRNGSYLAILSLKSGILPAFNVVLCEMGLTLIEITQNDGLFGSTEVK